MTSPPADQAPQGAGKGRKRVGFLLLVFAVGLVVAIANFSAIKSRWFTKSTAQKLAAWLDAEDGLENRNPGDIIVVLRDKGCIEYNKVIALIGKPQHVSPCQRRIYYLAGGQEIFLVIYFNEDGVRSGEDLAAPSKFPGLAP